MALTDLTRISTSGIATGSTIDSPILRKDVSLRGSQVGVTSALFDSSENELNFKDNVKLTFGNATNGDLRLYHQAPDNYILSNSGTTYIRHLPNGGDIKINATNIHLTNHSNNQTLLKTSTNGPVELYHAGNLKLTTDQAGVKVTGILTATSFSGPIIGSPINNPSGISTFYDVRVVNNLTVEGTTTTLDTNLIGVDRVEVGANSNSIVGVAVTQSGTADLVNLFDGATKVVTVDDEGQVGLGSAIPSTKLDVVGKVNINNVDALNLNHSTGVYQTFRHNGTAKGYAGTGNHLYTGGSSGDFGLAGGSSVNIVFATTNSERLRIAANGTIGIGGTTIPGALLDLSSAAPGILFSETGVSANNGKWLNQANASELYWQAQTDAHSGGGNLFKMTRSAQQIQSFEGQQSGATWFTVRNSDKKVGIGSAIPAERLVVQGNAFSNLSYDHDGGGFSSNSGGALVLTGYYDYSGAKLGLYVDNSGQGRIATKTSQNLHIGTNNSKHLTINNVGSVGIRTDVLGQIFTVKGATDIMHYPNSTIQNDRLQLGFNAPEGYIKAKNSTGSPAANIALYTTDTSGNTNKVIHVSHDKKVSINTATPSNQLHVAGTTATSAGGLLRLDATTGDNFVLYDNTHDSTEWAVGNDSTSRDKFDIWYHNGSSYDLKVRITGDGHILFKGDNTGGSSALGGFGTHTWTPKVQVLHDQGQAIVRDGNEVWGGALHLAKCRGTYASPSAAAQNDRAGAVYFEAHDGADFLNYVAGIESYLDGTVASNDTPGRLVFSTTADGGANSLTERMRITSSGRVNIGDTYATGTDLNYCRLNVYGQTTQGGTDKNLNLLNVYNYGSGNPGNITGIGLGAGASPDYTKASLAFVRNDSYGKGDLIFCINSAGNSDLVTETDEHLRLTKTGALALGQSPTSLPQENSGHYHQLQIGLGAHFYGRTDDTNIFLGSNAHRYGTAWRYTASTTASLVSMGTNIQFSVAGAGTALNTISFTEKFKIGGGNNAVEVKNANFSVFATSSSLYGANTSGAKGFYYDKGTASAQSAQPRNTGWSSYYINKHDGDGGSENRYIDFWLNGGQQGNITISGSGLNYGSNSDYRLKKDDVVMTDGISRVKQLRPIRFKWIKDDLDDEGFFAHEAQAVVPIAVDGTKDQVVLQSEVDAGSQRENKSAGEPIYQTMDNSKLVPVLTAALKEAIDKIETLEARISALEGS